MSDSWTVSLIFSDDRSNKFWRARTDGNTMYVNYGRVGTDGQTQVKEFNSTSAAQAALDKQANGKRKKGYEDDGNASGAADAAPAEVAPPTEPQSVRLSLEQGGRKIALELAYDGQTVRTSVDETYDSADAAAAAFVRIQQALASDGYKRQ